MGILTPNGIVKKQYLGIMCFFRSLISHQIIEAMDSDRQHRSCEQVDRTLTAKRCCYQQDGIGSMMDVDNIFRYLMIFVVLPNHPMNLMGVLMAFKR